MTSDFREQIEKRLSGISREDICYFAWLCAVRALPFLGTNGDFDYWKNTKDGDKRQIHLLAVLKALDATIAGAASGTTGAAAATRVAASAAESAAAESAVAVINSARTARITAARVASTNTTADAAAAASDTANAAIHANQAIDLTPVLFKDLENIIDGKRSFQNDTTIYGGIWNNFQNALRNLGCGYWGDWYASVFAKGFILEDDDREEINTRLSVPGEIRKRGAADTARYVVALKEQGAERLNETRVLILGDKGSGKTSLAVRLNDPTHPMPGDDQSTEGVDVVDWNIPSILGQLDSAVNVHIWDFAGHVITHAVHRCFMSERCLYILLINGRTEGDNRTEYWLEQIRNYGGDSPVLVLVNIKDKHRVDIPENTLKKEFPSIIGFYQLDVSKGGKPLEEFRQIVMELLRDNPLWKNQKMTASAYKVKEALRQQFAQGNEYIKRKKFDQIANGNGIEPKEHMQLLEDLRDLGICLWYDNDDMREFDTMVLNPSWISRGIYRLINWGMNNKKTTLSVFDFRKVFKGKDAQKYPEEKASFLFRLMKTYQLAFFKDDEQVFVPLLLPIDRPEDTLLPDFLFGERLLMEYRANQALPPFTVARLAVLHSAELDESISWRFGALLHWEDTIALVEESAQTVTVFVKGSKQTEYISRLRDTLNNIFDEYKSGRPKLKYEVLLPDWCANPLKNSLMFLDDPHEFLQSENQIISNANAGQQLVTGYANIPLIDPVPTIQAYDIIIGNLIIAPIINPQGNVLVGSENKIDHSQIINIEFRNCSINFQGDLNALAHSFRKLGNPEDIDLAEELEETASDLDEAIKEMPTDATPDSEKMEEVKTALRKKGVLNRLENLYDELCDDNSDLHKKAAKIRNGIKTLQKCGSRYNDVAQWFGLPQIPKPLLGTKEVSGGKESGI